MARSIKEELPAETADRLAGQIARTIVKKAIGKRN